MELTKNNYYDIEPTILKDIEESNFIALDLELSGLIQNKFKIYDSPEENFIKSKYNAENFRIIQLGICPFIKDKSNEKEYIVKPYNIYVFPSEKINNGKFDFYLESIIFNRNHGCDFNKWIAQGVPYLNEENLNKLLDRTLNGDINKYNQNNASSFKNISIYKDKDKIIYKNFFNKFNDFFNNPNEKIFKHEKINKHILLYFLNNLNEEIRKQIFIEHKEESIGLEIKEFIIIYKLTPEEKSKKLKEKKNEIMIMIKKEKGVKNIFEKIIEEKKPIIGHNCYIDLLFIMNYFIEEIPKSYKEFKSRLKYKFIEGIYDTKLLYNQSNLNFTDSNNLKNSIHLEALYKNLSKLNTELTDDKRIKVKIPLNEGFIDYSDEKNSSKFHQADYDAFTTGCAFIFMRNILGDNFIQNNKNKLNCYRGLYSCFNLNNNDENEEYLNNCSDVYVLNFNKDENIEEIINSKYINVKLGSKELGNSFIIFIKSEDKNKFGELIQKYKDLVSIKTIEEYREELKLKEHNKKK